METYFNELSIKDIEVLEYDAIQKLVEVYKFLKNEGINTCRIAFDDFIKLHNMVLNMRNSTDLNNFLFSFFKTPYETEAVEKKEDEYYLHEWLFEGNECFGLALGYLLDSLSLSIFQDKWNFPQISINMDDKDVNVKHVSRIEHLNNHKSWLQGLKEIELIKCSIIPEQKEISLRNDHGRDVLLDFSRKIVQNEYIVRVENSLPYNSHCRKFIKKVKENGLIEIVLPWTDQGLGVVVKTTGRNIRETEKIAKIIQDKYGFL